MYFRAALIAAVMLVVAGCRRETTAGPTKLAILPAANLTGDASLDALARALPAFLANQLEQSNVYPPVAVLAVGDAYSAGAVKVLHSYVETAPGGGVRLRGAIEDLRTHQRESVAIDATSKNGFLPLLKDAAAVLDKSAKPSITSNESALRKYADAISSDSKEKALAALAETVKLDPALGPAWMSYAQLSGDVAIAEQGSKQQQLSEKERLKLSVLASTLRGDTKAETEALTELAKVNSDDPQTLRLLMEKLQTAGKLNEAAEAARKLTEKQPNDLQAWNSLGYTYALLGDLPKAKQALEQYRKLAPQDLNSLDSLGEAYFLNGKFQEAAAYFDEAAGKNAALGGGMPVLKLAVAKLFAGDASGAEAAFGRYVDVRKKGNDPLLAYRQACWQFLTGKKAEALKAISALEQPEARAGGAMLFASEGDQAKARELAMSAMQTSNDQNVKLTAALAAFISQPDMPVEAWNARAEAMFKGPQAEAFRGQAVGLALLFHNKAKEAAPELSKIAAAQGPLLGSHMRELLAFAYTKAGNAAEAKPLTARWPLPPADIANTIPLIALSHAREIR